MTSRLALPCALLLTALAALPAAAEPVEAEHTTVELVPLQAAIQPGQPLLLGLQFDLEQDWHLYWVNPGDAGIPPKVKWELPKGFEAGELQFPTPFRFDTEGLTSFGYDGRVVFPLVVQTPEDLEPGTEVVLEGKASWLICADVCIPGKADLTLTMPVAEVGSPDDAVSAERLAGAQAKLPLAEHDWMIGVAADASMLVIHVIPPAGVSEPVAGIEFYPLDPALIDYTVPQSFLKVSDGYAVTAGRSSLTPGDLERVEGLLIAPKGWPGTEGQTALMFSAEVGDQLPSDFISSGTTAPPTAAPTTGASGTSAATSLGAALLLALLGGIILNLMPCVLPVLSLKIFGFINQAGESPKRVLHHGLVFTAGVLVSFWVLAGLLLLLKAGGAQLGWGFQLQSPGFVFILAAFLFVFALSLLGVFEIGTSLTAIGGKTQAKEGFGGSFLNGVTATVVATPCTAPFMGSALVFALQQSAAVVMLVFTMIGLGMSLPYLILSASPGLLKHLPKPGRWMEDLKQLMGFLLLATVVYLAWVLGALAGADGISALLMALLLLGMAAWVYGRFGLPSAPLKSQRVALGFAAALALCGGLIGFSGIRGASPMTPSAEAGELAWQPFSQATVEEHLAAGRPVFIDFTARWCLSCQVNEKVALSPRAVQEAFAARGIVTLKADWTNYDEGITQALAAYGRNSVPLYVLLRPGADEPILLPELLTPGIVLEALGQVEPIS